jgi:hypothetical protein
MYNGHQCEEIERISASLSLQATYFSDCPASD